jgi:hypothetical protein
MTPAIFLRVSSSACRRRTRTICGRARPRPPSSRPDPALDPLWISAFEPFHGAQKKDFGFRVTIKVEPE